MSIKKTLAAGLCAAVPFVAATNANADQTTTTMALMTTVGAKKMEEGKATTVNTEDNKKISEDMLTCARNMFKGGIMPSKGTCSQKIENGEISANCEWKSELGTVCNLHLTINKPL